jgi:N6-adenosine-specific RNA methylase IME4/ParB-like chromosome segregation protein Spo0J
MTMSWLDAESGREYHEVSSLFPLLEGADYEALKADIAQNGLLEPIWLHPDGSIIDGRNRYRACIETGTEPRFRTWNGEGSLVAFVLSLNLHRRHLDESQRAMVAARIASMPQGARTDLAPIGAASQPEAAKAVNVGRRSVQRAQKVIDKGIAELQRAVDTGKVAVSVGARVAEMPQEQQGFFVDAVNSGASASKAKRETERHFRKQAPPLPEGKYSVLYADPPWQYDNTGFHQSAESQYPTMSVEEISNLPVQDLATDETILFLWATNPLLPEALQVMHAWGFEYKTNIAWVKDRGRGWGWWLRSKHELLLVGVRSKAKHPEVRLDSCFLADRGSVHSKKPEVAYEIIERMYPTCPRIELFARETREGWTAWGNEV